MTSRLSKVKEKVFLELVNRPETRNDDRLLFAKVYEDYYGIKDEPFFEVMMRRDLPSFESIRRCRAKIQAANSWLRPNEAVQEFRDENEAEYYSFMGGNHGKQITAF